VTAGQPLTEILPAAQVAELVNNVVKALRAFHMYLPNNPIYQRATENVRAAFTPIWAAVDQLALTVAETDFVWEEQVVYHQPAKGESLAWGLFKDGMRSLTIRRGAEEEELTRFLETVNQARYLAADAGDDLLTLLWQQEFQFIQYHFVEFFGEGGGSLPEASGAAAAGANDAETAKARHAQAVEEAPPRPKGVVDLEDFDSTLYFLDEAEINAVAADLKEEYRRDARGAAINVLFDLFELQGEPSIRDEILGTREGLFPGFLNARDFRTAAAVLRDSKVVAGRAPGLTPEHRARLEAFVTKLSEPAIVSQLVQSLDEASAVAGQAEVAEVLRELQGAALEPVLAWLPRLSSAPLREVLEGVVDRLATAHGNEVLRMLRNPESEALAGVVPLCGRLMLHQAVPGLGEVSRHPDPALRLAAVQALAQLGTPAALGFIEQAIEDGDRAVRLVAVRAAGARGYKGALKRVEGVVLGRGVKEMDLTEKMAFFEAYGAIAGPAGLKALSGILLPRGLLKLKEPPETRACAAMALGKIRSPEARELLQKVVEDKDLVVRNAANRALRESAQ
jgi:HEAT repeat protein